VGADMGQVNLPLALDGKLFLQKLSSDEYEILAFEAFLPADLLYTFVFRYPMLFYSDIPEDHTTKGYTVDQTQHNPILAVIATLVIGGLAALNFYREYRKQKKARDSNSHQAINSQLDNQDIELGEQIKAWLKQQQAINRQSGEQDQEELDKQIEAQLEQIKSVDKTKWINEYLQKMVFTSDPTSKEFDEEFYQELRRKYSSIKMEKGQLQFTFKDNNDNVTNPDSTPVKEAWYYRPFNAFRNSWLNKKIISPIYEALSISSFAYWLLWIGAGTYTGIFGSGVAGLSEGIAFGLPLGLGLMYPLIKGINFFRGKKYAHEPQIGDDATPPTDEQKQTAENDAVPLLRRIVLRRRCDLVKKVLEAEQRKETESFVKLQLMLPKSKPEPDLEKKLAPVTWQNEPIYLQEHLAGKTVMSFFSSTVGGYSGMQYGAWIVTDFLAKVAKVASDAPIVNTVMGWILIGLGVLHGIHRTITGHYERQQIALTVQGDRVKETDERREDLETIYKGKLEAIQTSNSKLGDKSSQALVDFFKPIDHPQFFGDKSRANASWKSKLKKGLVRALTVVNFFTSGAFFARMFFVPGNAVFLPFAAVALSNPYTIGVIIGVGILYGLFKGYEYHVKRKEERAKEALKKNAERIEYLKQQIKLAHRAELILEMRVTKSAAAAKKSSSADSSAAADQRRRSVVGNNSLFAQQQQPPAAGGLRPSSPPVRRKSVC